MCPGEIHKKTGFRKTGELIKLEKKLAETTATLKKTINKLVEKAQFETGGELPSTKDMAERMLAKKVLQFVVGDEK